MQNSSNNFDERIEQKIFHAEIVVDNAKVAAETKAYKKIPVIADFTDDVENDVMQQVIEHNYNQIKTDVKQIVTDELTRIADDPELQHLIKKRISAKNSPVLTSRGVFIDWRF